MDNLEPYEGFYNENEYEDFEKRWILYATVSMLYFYIYKYHLQLEINVFMFI